MKKMMRNMREKLQVKILEAQAEARDILETKLNTKRPGIDGILVTVGLCIIALLLCVVMKDSLSSFITTIVDALKTKAIGILG